MADVPDGGQLLRRPQHEFSTYATVHPMPSWSVTPKLRFVGSRYDELYDNSGNSIGRGRVGGYTMVDLAADYKLIEHVTAYSTLRNLFDRTVESPNGYVQEPLMVLVGLRYQN